MKTEEAIREALRIDPAEHPAGEAAWTAFETRYRRSRRRRVAAASAGAFAAAAATVFALAMLPRGLAVPAPVDLATMRPVPAPPPATSAGAGASAPATDARPDGSAGSAFDAGASASGGANAAAQSECAPAHGTLAGGIACDAATAGMIAFMDARIAGGGADAWLSEHARGQYEGPEGGLSLYSPSESTPYVGYTIESRAPRADGTYDYRVRIIQRARGDAGSSSAPSGSSNRASLIDQNDTSFVELLGAGPGETHRGDRRDAVILRAERDLGPPARVAVT